MRHSLTTIRRTALVVTSGLVVTLGVSTSASAAPSDPERTINAVEQVAPAVDVLETEQTSDGSYEAEGEDGLTVSIPQSTDGEVGLSTAGGALTVGLPDVSGATATAASDGTVVYDGASVDVAVQALPDGVRMQAVIADSTAPTRLEYALGAGDLPLLATDGSVWVASDAGLVHAVAPWAFDANGVPVPTHYEVQGAALVQVVDHTGAGIAYPVVADPTFITGSNIWFGGFFGAVRFNRTETNQIAAGAGAATAALFIAQKFAGLLGLQVSAVVTALDITAAAVTVWAAGAVALNKCAEVRLYPNPFGLGRPALYPLYWGC